MVGAVFNRACMACARGVLSSPCALFLLSEAGWPGWPGFSGWGRLGMRRKGLEDLHVYRNQQEQEDKVRRTLMCPADAATRARDRPSRYGGRGAFFCRAGAVSRDCSLILAILIILAILLQRL